MNDKFNSLLTNWAAKKAPAQEHLDRLARGVSVAAATKRTAAHQAEYSNAPLLPFWSKLGYAATGAVVAVAVMAVCLRWQIPTEEQRSHASGIQGIAAIDRNHLQAQTRLFSEVERMFNNQLRWIAQSDGDMGIGVESDLSGARENPAPYLVHLVAVSRTEGKGAWRQVWSADVILRGEDMVEVVPNGKKDNSLALWVYPLQDGKIAVDTSLALSSPFRLASRAGAVVQRGRPSEIAALRTGDTEYRVFQTVEKLPAREKNG